MQRPDGTVAAGPPTTWKGLNKPHRADRRWATAWSPEQISRRLVLDFPDDIDMRISHEAIYQALYIQGRGALKRELVACLRTGRALRKPRERSRNKPQGHVTADVVFSERPGEAEDRAVPGHWEGDLIIGLNRSAIGTVVERSSRYTLLVHLPRLEGYGTIAPGQERARSGRLRGHRHEGEQSSRPVDEDLLGGFGLGVVVGSFDELAVDERGAGADERDQVRGVDRAPAVLGGLDELERHRQPGGA